MRKHEPIQVARLSPKRLSAVAHHEAGHVIAAHVAGRVIQDVCISDTPLDKGEYGRSRHINPLATQDIPSGDPRLAEMGTWELIISLAGPEAEKRVDPDRKVAPSDLAEQEWILSCIDKSVSRAEIDEYVRDVKRQARQLVTDNWAAIGRVATALIERGTLTGDEVVQIISST
jgi:hypothetical protein